MTSANPTNVAYGYVKARFATVEGDRTDPDRDPDWKPDPDVQILFTPAPKWLLNATATPDPLSITPIPVPCTSDTNGYLLGPDGNIGVYLIATDDPDNNPTDWTYTCEITSPSLGRRVFSMKVPSGGTVDLAVVSPVNSSTGNAVVVGPRGPIGPALGILGSKTDVTQLPASGASLGEAWITGNDGHMHVWSGSVWVDTGPIVGPQGVQGDTGPAPVITWTGTTIVVDGATGPDLKGAKGDTGNTGPAPVVTWAGTVIVVDGTPGPNLQGVQGDRGIQGLQGDPGPAPTVTWSGTTIVVEGVTGPDLKGAKGDQGNTLIPDPNMDGFFIMVGVWLPDADGLYPIGTQNG